jgi:hypothetical protein
MSLMIVASKRLMRREDAAAYLCLSTTRFDRLTKEGRLTEPSPLSDLYGYKVWDRTDLDRWVDAHGAELAPVTQVGTARAANATNPYAHLEE